MLTMSLYTFDGQDGDDEGDEDMTDDIEEDTVEDPGAMDILDLSEEGAAEENNVGGSCVPQWI